MSKKRIYNITFISLLSNYHRLGSISKILKLCHYIRLVVYGSVVVKAQRKYAVTTESIVLPNARSIRMKMWATVKKDEAFIEGLLSRSLSTYSEQAMSPQDFVRRLLCTINLVTQATPPESDLQMIMFSRIPRYIDALVTEDVREAVHARFERIKESTYT